ncbi:Dolichyl-phosphate-mannose-protein mannosyltransferase [Epilithonimonas lactis]|uniref:Glycosyltransferase RgtA/B/C/D-like domain-containing protein n=2 Tax=Epilithonimonas lactis TaxID=421072 RepID=A0A085BED4_9FLAO|nr:hypothetical protein IO89_11340 [Epilithonimonas lactis]SEP63023.1 Dolichyl-phosphate-mannose-protein mannosyltransferase [Epilithonimonas lactis]
MFAKLKTLLTYKNLLIMNLFIVIVKILYIILIQKEFVTLEDFTIAKNIVKYHQYSEFIDQGGTAFKLPVYPFFISFFLEIFGDNALLGIAIFQALLSFFTPILLFRITKLFGFEKVGIIAGFFFIFSPSYFLYPGIIEASNVFISILLLWFYLYFKIWFSVNNSNNEFIILGIVSALLFLTQVVVVPLACIMILALLIFKKINFRQFSFIVIVTALLYSPWVIRNYIIFDKIVLSKTPAWQNIYYGFTENGQLMDDLKLISKEKDHQLYQTRDEINELVMEKIYEDEIVKATKNEPHYFVKKAASNFFCLWFVPPKYFDDNSLSVLFGRKIYVVLLNIFTLVSLVFLYRRSKLLFWFSLLFFANFSFPYMIGHAANMRFKLDFEWYQFILIALLILEFAGYYKQKKRI